MFRLKMHCGIPNAVSVGDPTMHF